MLTMPTCPVRTHDVDENAKITTTIRSTSIPAPRRNDLPPLTPCSIVKGSRMFASWLSASSSSSQLPADEHLFEGQSSGLSPDKSWKPEPGSWSYSREDTTALFQ